MSWIAKNRITGKVYGKKFKCIYDCQKYIDTELIFIQYEWRRVLALESEFDDEEAYQNYIKSKKSDTFLSEIFNRVEFGLKQIADNNHKSPFNVIQCYNVRDERWCDGFDF